MRPSELDVRRLLALLPLDHCWLQRGRQSDADSNDRHLPRPDEATVSVNSIYVPGLADEAGDLVAQYCTGMAKKVPLATALLHIPAGAAVRLCNLGPFRVHHNHQPCVLKTLSTMHSEEPQPGPATRSSGSGNPQTPCRHGKNGWLAAVANRLRRRGIAPVASPSRPQLAARSLTARYSDAPALPAM